NAEYRSQFRSWSTGEYSAADIPKHPDLPPIKIIHAQSKEMPVVEMADYRAWSHLRAVHEYGRGTLGVLTGLGLLAYLLSGFFGVNRFSMHAFYRNRIIRAYLGASRYRRQPNSFTGFDKHDNIKMWQLRPDYYTATSIAN